MIVLDASALVELLLNTTAGRLVADRMRDPAVSVHIPHLADIEVTEALRRYAAAGDLGPDAAASALRDLRELDLERHAHEPLLPRVWELRRNLSAYDAIYVALAEVLDAPLLTCDRRLSRAPGVTARIQVV